MHIRLPHVRSPFRLPKLHIAVPCPYRGIAHIAHNLYPMRLTTPHAAHFLLISHPACRIYHISDPKRISHNAYLIYYRIPHRINTINGILLPHLIPYTSYRIPISPMACGMRYAEKVMIHVVRYVMSKGGRCVVCQGGERWSAVCGTGYCMPLYPHIPHLKPHTTPCAQKTSN
jgi:hypothetical protein